MSIQVDPNPEGRSRVLVLDPIHINGINLIREVAAVDIVEGVGLTTEQLEACIGDYHALINRSRTPIPDSVIRRGENLRIIVRAGVGLDNIDVAVAEEMGVQVANCPNANTIAVAEHTFALMLGLARHIAAADRSMKNGLWEKSRFRGSGLAGKTLGIIGFGHIGREVAVRAKAFGMNVLVNQTRHTHELAQEWNIELVKLGELLSRADYLTLHVPMRASNVNMIGKTELDLMQPHALLVNTSRGGIVDEDALLDALNHGTIAGAALDVFVDEPKPNPTLAGHSRVLATPHIGASTEDAQQRAASDAAAHVLEALKRKRLADTLSLRLAAVEDVTPHERYHPRRVEKLADRIAEDGFLGNPPVVVEADSNHTDSNYIVLDGATRVTAFKHLGHPHIVVQVVDVERDNVQLHTWYHVVHGIEAGELVELAHGIEHLRLTEMAVESLAHALWEKNALGYFVTAAKHGYLLELEDAADGVMRDEASSLWVDVLNELVDGYGRIADVERTLNTDIDELSAQYADFAGLIVFPQFPADVVLRTVSSGHLLPAGLTRFVIPGRILRLNAPISILAGKMSFNEKCDWLDSVVKEKLTGRRLRYYEEPVVLLDE